MKYSKSEIPVQSFDSEGVMNRQQVWKVGVSMSRPQIWKLIGAILLVCTLPLQSAPQDKAVFIPFDAPGSVQGTYPTSLSPAGVIVGYVFIDNNGTPNAFIRA